jgi:hypothetical protein
MTSKQELATLAQQDFLNDREAAKRIKTALQLYDTANEATRRQIAFDKIVNEEKFVHCASAAVNALNEIVVEVTEVTNDRNILKAENEEYKKHYGPLDPETVERTRRSVQAIPLDNAMQKTILLLQKHSRQLAEKSKES